MIISLPFDDMSNFRIFILAFLVVVLVVLGMIYVNISSRMDVIQQQQQMASAPVPVNPSPYLPMPTQAPASAVQPVVVADPVLFVMRKPKSPEVQPL